MIYAFPFVGEVCDVVESSDITLEKLRVFSDRTRTMITVDAPLFGSVMLLHGRVLDKGSAVEPEKIISQQRLF